MVEHGYEGLSARKVAAAIGYTVGTLYLVFENLDDLSQAEHAVLLSVARELRIPGHLFSAMLNARGPAGNYGPSGGYRQNRGGAPGPGQHQWFVRPGLCQARPDPKGHRQRNQAGLPEVGQPVPSR
ncbi:helix-turn-helix domain-containing protein [Pseudomonadota bacterium]